MFDDVVRCLPVRVGRELLRIADTRQGGRREVSELHITIGKRSSALIGGERIFLGVDVSSQDMDATVHRLCGGAIYAHRDTIGDGFISLSGGVRVGICGQARYESDRLVGVSEVSSLVFRMPTVTSSLSEELYSAWQGSANGLLIYSPPGGGKTTALRTLVCTIAERCPWERVAVVDERCEFSVDECRGLGVMLLRGYKRADGMEIALRTMSPSIIAVDEIGARQESDAMVESLNSGIRIIATAHARECSELEKRRGLEPFLRVGAFDVFFGIFHTDAGYSCKIEEFVC